MESNYNNRDFEQFVKQNADQYRMFPSEKVWQGIDNALHTRRKWYGLGLALLLLITGAGVTWVMITTPGNKNLKTTAQVLPQDPNVVPVKVIVPKQTAAPVKNVNAPLVFSNDAVPASATNTSLNDILINDGPVDPVNQDNNNTDDTRLQTVGTGVGETGNIMASMPAQKAARTASSTFSITRQDIVPFISPVQSIVHSDEIIIAKTDKKEETTATEKNQPSRDSYYPLTIESVVNSYNRPALKKKVSFQVYFTPTVSYRKLSENKEFLRSAAAAGNVPNYAAYNDVKNYVTHKPDIGLELGLAARYPISKRLIVKAGVQFNVSRYDIRAFTSPRDTATLRLNSLGRDSTFERESSYQTRSNGNRANWLQNLYYSVSVPIGVEYKFAEKNKNHFGIAATIQPTYIISDQAYLISTNYKNYVTVPGSILRRFNLNTGFQVFVGYSTNKFNWQIGPQVRYQTRSTFKDKYPVKENLFDFGIKVGVMFKKKSF
jgi:hypothetical protein